MPDESRGRQFANFARLLLNELAGEGGYIDIYLDWDEEDVAKYQTIIARRAYDLVAHTLTLLDKPESIGDITDLAAFPKGVI